MKNKISIFLDKVSNFLSRRKGFLPFIGLLLIVINFIFSLQASNWFAQTNFFLHFGIIVAILGFLLAWAL